MQSDDNDKAPTPSWRPSNRDFNDYTDHTSLAETNIEEQIDGVVIRNISPPNAVADMQTKANGWEVSKFFDTENAAKKVHGAGWGSRPPQIRGEEEQRMRAEAKEDYRASLLAAHKEDLANSNANDRSNEPEDDYSI